MSINRREFMQAAMAGGAFCAGCSGTRNVLTLGYSASAGVSGISPCLVSPGCRKSKVKIAKIYMVNEQPMWPHPELDYKAEIKKYEDHFALKKDELADVDFFCNETVTSPQQMAKLKSQIKNADGILAIHISWRILPILQEILSLNLPTALFAAPYSGHDWVAFGKMQKVDMGKLMECYLTSDMNELVAAIRPFRAIHHLREAKILNVTTKQRYGAFREQIQQKFGTKVKYIDRERVLAAYEAASEKDAKIQARRWMSEALKVVEPSEEEIIKSCRLGLAFKQLLDEEEATTITADCYGSMYHKLPAFPCIGFVMLNNMGLGGVCESDVPSALTHILYQGLCGKPGFVNDPTMDVSTNSIILAHCLGSTKMDGPEGKADPYKIRTIMERQEGAVIQSFMRKNQKATTARFVASDKMVYFTGTITDAPDIKRGCRTKITVEVDGDAEKLWQNWNYGLHRVTCYGDISKELMSFCKYKGVDLVNEAV